ncbi:MAG: hypothetical protein JF614_10535 [Acidobacteria bacterium]|nr:hypothetical protein [Acidobacteriota bacterium]
MMTTIHEGVANGGPLSIPSAFLDTLGRTVIRWVDYRVMAILALSAIVFVALVKKSRRKEGLSLGDCIRAAAAVFTILSGFLILCAFVFTKPPATDALSNESLGYIGTVVTIVTFMEGYQELKRLLGASVGTPPPPPSTP